MNAWSTDLAGSPAEGSAADPLRLATPRCVFTPFVSWQQQLCTQWVPTAWPGSNAQSTSLSPDRWRVVVNVENAWDTSCNTGPPAQSLSVTDPAIKFTTTAVSATVGIDLANEMALCSKIPYVAIGYVRGLQGDTQRALSTWGEKPMLAFNGVLTRTIGPTFAQSVHFYAHLRDPATGTRYMAHTHLWQSGYEPPDFRINWNWPISDSYYFPGAWIHGGDSETCPVGTVRHIGDAWTVDLEALGLCRFPEFATLHPDILGFEIAAEGAYLDYVHTTGLANRVSFTVSNPAVTLQ